MAKGYRPEQISGRLREEGVFISHESIYPFVWRDKQIGGNLYKHLRRQGKKYNKRSSRKASIVFHATVKKFHTLPCKVWTITFDNGKEFARHERIATALKQTVILQLLIMLRREVSMSMLMDLCANTSLSLHALKRSMRCISLRLKKSSIIDLARPLATKLLTKSSLIIKKSLTAL